MIPSAHSLVTLKPARQAALQAIINVETSRERGARLPWYFRAVEPCPLL